MSGSQNALPWQEKNNNQSYFHSRWYNNPIGEVTEWFMVPLSKFVVGRGGLWSYVQGRTSVSVRGEAFCSWEVVW